MNKKLFMVASLLLAGTVGSFVCAADTVEAEMQHEDLAVEQELFTLLNGHLQELVFPDEVVNFGQACEYLVAELEKTAQTCPDLFQQALEKYGKEVEGLEQKFVEVFLSFYLTNLPSVNVDELGEVDEAAFFKVIEQALSQWEIPADVRTYAQFIAATTAIMEEAAQSVPEVFAALISKYVQKMEDGREVFVVTLPLLIKG